MNVFVQQCGQQFSWLQISDEAIHAEYFEGGIEDLVQFFKQNELNRHWFFIPALIDVVTKRIQFTDKEKKHIVKAIPFMLEEDVITEIDQLQVLTHKHAPNQINVLAIEKQKLAQWHAVFSEHGINIPFCLPSCTFLPEYDAEWLILVKDNEVIIETPEQKLGADHALLADMLRLLTEDYAQLPQSIALLDCSRKHRALDLLPNAVAHLISPIDIDYAQLLQDKLAYAKKWNFFKGQYNNQQSWLTALKPWRWVLLGLVALYVLNLGINIYKTARYETDYKVIRKETDQLFRQVIPRGAIVDHKRQLNNLLKTQDTSNQILLSSSIQQMVKALGSTEIDLNTFNFDQDRKELRLDFLIDDFASLEAFMSEIKAQGLTADLLNSAQQDEKLKVNLKVGL